MRNIIIMVFVLLIVSRITQVAADEASVTTGIANTGKMTIDGDVSIDVNIAPKVDDLVAVLSIRAEGILRKINEKRTSSLFGNNNPEAGKKFAKEFQGLHEKHIQLLKEGKFVAAHSILGEIHRLSFEYEMSTKLSLGYFCSFTRYIRGAVVNAYVVNDHTENSRKYKLADLEKMANESKRKSACGPSYKMASIASIFEVYNMILVSQ